MTAKDGFGDHPSPNSSGRLPRRSHLWVPIAGCLGVLGLSLWMADDAVRVVVQTSLLLLIAGYILQRSLRDPFALKLKPGEIIFVGESQNFAILRGVLEGRHVRRDVQNPILRVPTVEEARTQAARTRCSLIVVADPLLLRHKIVDASARPAQIVSEVSLIEQLLGRIPIDLFINNPWMLEFRPETYRTQTQSFVKRIVDLIVASYALLVLLPAMALIALISKIVYGRPVLIKTPCVGQNERLFSLHQFRTTNVVPDDNSTALRLLSARSGWGNFLRSNRFDLMPSLWNIIRGDLSLVGPRPETAAYVGNHGRDSLYSRFRHLCRPGLISFAQVQFRYTEAPRDIRVALEYDLYYVKYGSLRLDHFIFVRGLYLAIVDSVAYLIRIGLGNWRKTAALLANARSHAASHASNVSLPLPRNIDLDVAQLKATLLIGAGSGGRLMANEMRSNPAWGYWPVAYLDDDPVKIGVRIDGLPVLGTTEAIPTIVQREHVEAIVIAIPSAPEAVINRIAELARQTPVRVFSMSHLGESLRSTSGQMKLRSVQITDILGRPVVFPDLDRCESFIAGRRVLVTGAAGSIGSEVARQVARLSPALLVGLDVNESDLFDLQQELIGKSFFAPFVPVVASITNRARIEAVFEEFKPEIVFHAAAYKHVPMMEEYPQEAVWSNTIGTFETARAAVATGVERFVLVSSDKAVRPSSVMGATKRLAELALRAVSEETGLSSCAVRFGNVLGSRGSVIPTFEKQIKSGGPLTVTDSRMKRYFMTIPEAAGLIVQAGAFGDRNAIYMLDMGDEVAIKDLAERMIQLHGLRVGTDIEIIYTGLRPGEKLREELSLDFEVAQPTSHPKIRILANAPHAPSRPGSIAAQMAELIDIADAGRRDDIRRIVLTQVELADHLELSRLYDGQHWSASNESVPSTGQCSAGAS